MVRGHRPRRLFVAMVLIVVTAGAAILPEVVAAVAMPASGRVPGGDGLRIVQFNLFKGNPTPAESAAWIVSQNADIVVVEEATHDPNGVVARLAPLYPYHVSCLSEMRCSTVILSRRSPVAAGGLAHGDPENRKAVSGTWAKFADRYGAFTVIGVHLQRPWPLGRQTDAQLAVAQFIAAGDPSRTIVAGDFNLTPWTFAMKRQDALFGIPRLTHGLWSWPVPFPVLPIDQVYAGSAWRLGAMQRGPATGSDHYPLAFTLVPSG